MFSQAFSEATWCAVGNLIVYIWSRVVAFSLNGNRFNVRFNDLLLNFFQVCDFEVSADFQKIIYFFFQEAKRFAYRLLKVMDSLISDTLDGVSITVGPHKKIVHPTKFVFNNLSSPFEKIWTSFDFGLLAIFLSCSYAPISLVAGSLQLCPFIFSWKPAVMPLYL